jgi:hypothetical protein
METEDYQALPLRLVYRFLDEHGLSKDAAELRESDPAKGVFEQHYKRRQAKRGFAIAILRSKRLFEGFISKYWPNGESEDGKQRTEIYEQRYREASAADIGEVDAGTLDDADEEAQDIEVLEILEKQIQAFLARNLEQLEPGLSLWTFSDGRSAVEYQVDDRLRRVDILAKDSSGIPVVIELKTKRGHEKVVGQILYYMGRVKTNLGEARARGIIVAREISPEIRIATADLPDIGLVEYKLALTLTRVR